MEASKFGFGENMPPSFKFDPTDADIVGRYLLPRALGLPNPHAGAIIEGDDPGSAPPWELLARHGHHHPDGDHHAFFFGPPQNPGRQTRTLKGDRGVWMRQKGEEDTVTLLHPDGGEADIRYKRYNLCFALKKGGPCTGYVMDEYTLLEPPLPGTVLTRIRIRHKTQKTAKRQRVAGAYAANQQHEHPVPEQTGPSYDYDAAANGVYGFAGAQEGAFYDSSNGGQGGYHYPPLQYDLPVCDYQSNYGVSLPDQPGPSYEHDAAANSHGFAGAQEGAYCDSSNGGGGYHYPPLQYDFPVCDYQSNYGVSNSDQPSCSYNYNEGFTDAQTDACYGGAYYDRSNFVPAECGSEYRNYHDDYCQPSQYEQGPSNHYQAGDAAVMWAGDERCIGEYSQPSQYEQQDPSNQYQAGDAAVMCAGDERFNSEEEAAPTMCAGDEGFIGEEEADGNSDKGSVTGTDTSARSTISTSSLCGDREDDATFLDTVIGIGDGDDFKCEQNDAGNPTTEQV
ncbi:unnamed protein product [Alopecurus aequalis]